MADHHQLHVHQLVDVLAYLLGHRTDHAGQLLLDAGVDGVADELRQAAPELRILALHDPLDDQTDVALCGGEDVLRDFLRLQLLIDIGGAADLGDRGVDREAAHFGGAGRDDPLPADATVHHSRDLLDLPRRQADQEGEPRDPPAPELDRVEQHQHTAPVGDVADYPGEQRDGEGPDQLRAHAIPLAGSGPELGPVWAVENLSPPLKRRRSPPARNIQADCLPATRHSAGPPTTAVSSSIPSTQ